jgi:DNA-binding PucR family transcriptional regulator
VILATMLQDELARQALIERYLSPLDCGERGAVLRETLRAYFAAEHNAQSAAAALGARRETVTRRLKTIEERLGRPIGERRVELETALRLEQLHAASTPAKSRTLSGRSSTNRAH